ncbi:Nucleoside-diphosphate-sugar epimerase [Chitinophaga filiformis]|uniref:Nucleoside-diphosphate-sugar epimerase n=2 Tax=Chitinophaga filiformis TaxID=104663 RepID=A0A1G8BJ84_CHIFI|nr:Nucleoside-diphosphate-sugar epimerase [Chitinophaga filiformis]
MAELCDTKKNIMRVFVTGATGFVGSAIIQELIGAGHQVVGLARSEAAAKALITAGAEVYRGNIDDLDSLQRGAAAADGVIHTAFNHDFSNFKAITDADRGIVDALGTACAGPFIVTSAIGVLPPSTRLLTEEDMPGASMNNRKVTEEACDAVAAKGVSVSVVRLPPSVHGEGDHGFIPMLMGIAKEKGISVYVEEGLNRWPAVHVLDAARLYRLALEKGAAAGTRYHAVGDEGVTFREIAEVIGKHLKVPVVSKSKEEAAAHFGWFAHFAAMNVPASAAQTQEALGWAPVQPGLLADLKSYSYFSLK